MTENILYVGDRIDKDIKPALIIGFKPVLKAAYTNTGKKLPEGACKITHLSELPGLVEKTNAGVVKYSANRSELTMTNCAFIGNGGRDPDGAVFTQKTLWLCNSRAAGPLIENLVVTTDPDGKAAFNTKVHMFTNI